MVDINKRLNLIKGDISAIGAAEKLKSVMDSAGKSVRDAFANTPTTLQERLKSVGTTATNTSKQFNDLRDNATAALNGLGSNSAGIARTQKSLADVQKRIEELKTAFRSGAKDADLFAKEMSDLENQARKLDFALDAAGEKRRLDVETGTLTDPSKRGSGAGLRQFGRELRNLPSTQIPGLGIGTDAIGNITRVSGALVDVGEKSKVVTVATSLLTPALGAQAAATYAAFAPIALLLVGFTAIVVGLKALVDSTSSNADAINSFAKNQRDLNKQIADGLTTDKAQQDLDKLTEAQARNKKTLVELQAAYDSSQRQLGVLGGVAKVFSGDEEALANQITETSKAVTDQQGEMNVLARAIREGSLAANDAAAAVKDITAKQEEYRTALDASQQSLKNYTDQITALNASLERQQATAAAAGVGKMIEDIAEGVISANEKAEDANLAREERESTHNTRMAAIETQGDKQIESLRQQSTQKFIDTQNAIGKLQSDFDKSEASDREKFRQDQLEKERQFRQREADIKLNYEQSISEARLNFSVQGFMKADIAKEDAERDLRRDRNANKREGRRFEVEREEAKKTLDERIAGLQTELTAFQAAQQIKIDTELNAINERKLAEQAAFDASEQKLTEREARLEQRAEARAERQEAREDRRAEAVEVQQQFSHSEQLKRIEGLRDAETERIETLNAQLTVTDFSIASITGSAEKLAAVAGEIVKAAEKLGYDPYAGTRPPIAGGERDYGGMGEAGKAYLIGRRAQPELFIPSSSGRFIPNADRMGINVTISAPVSFAGANIGENVSRGDLQRIEKQMEASQKNIVDGVKLALHKGQKPTF